MIKYIESSTLIHLIILTHTRLFFTRTNTDQNDKNEQKYFKQVLNLIRREIIGSEIILWNAF